MIFSGSGSCQKFRIRPDQDPRHWLAVRKFKRWFDCYHLFAGNLANVLRYFPTQALNFAFKDTVKGLFKTPKVRLYNMAAGGNIPVSNGQASDQLCVGSVTHADSVGLLGGVVGWGSSLPLDGPKQENKVIQMNAN